MRAGCAGLPEVLKQCVAKESTKLLNRYLKVFGTIDLPKQVILDHGNSKTFLPEEVLTPTGSFQYQINADCFMVHAVDETGAAENEDNYLDDNDNADNLSDGDDDDTDVHIDINNSNSSESLSQPARALLFEQERFSCGLDNLGKHLFMLV